MFDIQSNKQVAAYLRTLAWDLDQAKVQCTQVVITHRPPTVFVPSHKEEFKEYTITLTVRAEA